MSSWKVRLTPNAEIEFKKMLLQRVFSPIDLALLRTWLNEMEEFGPEHIAESKLWNDHSLYYEWQGFRASCFSPVGRVVYKVINQEVLIEVHRITNEHDYRKKED